MAKFDLGAQPDVAGEESNHGRGGESAERIDELADAGAGAAVVGFGQQVIEPEHVSIEKATHVFASVLDVGVVKDFPDE